MNKTNKHQEQFKEAKKGIELFYYECLLLTNYQDLQNHLNNLEAYFLRSQKDKALNKNIILFKNYFKNEAPKKRDIETIKKKKVFKNIRPKKSYKDYLIEYQFLRNKGYSYKKISDYSKQYFKVSVSKETVRNFLNREVKNDR